MASRMIQSPLARSLLGAALAVLALVPTGVGHRLVRLAHAQPPASSGPPPAPSPSAPPPSSPSVAPAPPPAGSAATPASTVEGPHEEDSDEEGEDAPAPPAVAPVRPPANQRPVPPLRDGMLRLPGATFTMGTADKTAPPNERPPRVVRIAPFWIDRTEVTVAAYRACVEAQKCPRPQRASIGCTYDLDDPNLPVSCVRFHDAEAYCRFAGRRLPNESEWEYAARGAHGFRYPWGSVASSCFLAGTLLHESTSKSCTGRHPSAVGTHPFGASVFGVLDMSGNVEEWTADWYAETVAEGAAPRAGASHVLRGGGWLSPPSGSRTTTRNWGSDMEAGANVGFRCARTDDASGSQPAPAPPTSNPR